MQQSLLWLRRGLLAGGVMLLAACGGGGGSAGTPGFGPGAGGGTGGGGGGTPTPTAADLVLVLSAGSLPNDGSQNVLATVTAVDANRNIVAGVPVTVTADSLAVVSPSGTVTDAGGSVTASVSIGSDQTNRTITVTAQAGALTKTATLQVRDATVIQASGPTLSLSLSSTVVTSTAPVSATVTLRSLSGQPLPNVVVSLSTARGNLAQISAQSVLTSATGVATVQLQPAVGGATGADELIANATVGSVQVSGRQGFNVVAASPTLSILPPATTTLRASTNPPLTLQARVLDAQGAPVVGQVVSFASANGNTTLSPTTVLTNASGIAATTARPRDGSASSADTVRATATVSGLDLLGQLGVQIVGELPSIELSLSSSNVSSTSPPTATATVKDPSGAPVKDVVVGFAAQFGLVAFDASTAVTDAAGQARVVVSPRTATASGADVLIASAIVGGVTQSKQAAVQVSSSAASGTPVLQLALSSTSISAASPATVTATLTDARGVAAAGQVVTFNVVRGLATTNNTTALTGADGKAAVQLSPRSSSSSGADEINVAASFAGASLQATRGFTVSATSVTIDQFSAATDPLSAYGQTPLTIALSGASVTSPVSLSLSSSCVSQGKASLSPATLTSNINTVTVQYRDNGCGALQTADQLQVVVNGTAISRSLALQIQPPAAASLAFVQALPESIFLKGSGFTESSIVSFEVRDAAGNALPGRVVELRLQTGAGGVTMEGRVVESVQPPSANPFTQTSNAQGRVSVRVNSGTQPTPVRVHAKLAGETIATVSSNLSVGIGLPSQLNFSLSQTTKNIEGYDIDGTANVYQIIAADRSGNPVPAGTSINFVTEGGQIEAIKQTQIVAGIARTTAGFVSSSPRPVDGRVTITAYALGEESFIDLNGNNTWDTGEPFQDLGNVFKDRNFDGVFDPSVDEFLPLDINNSRDCVAPQSPLLALDPSIPSVSQLSRLQPSSAGGTCDGTWSGAGQVYVRRAVETVLSTSGARPLWASVSGLDSSCTKIQLQTGSATTQFSTFTLVSGNTRYGSQAGVLSFIAADRNPGRPTAAGTYNPATDNPYPRLNPMAAGTVVSASGTTGLTVTVSGGSPVPSTSEASTVSVSYSLDSATSGTVFVTFTSPSGTGTTVAVGVTTAANPGTDCPP